ncbi:unnamed protein product [Prunus armeniaca]|uniref:Uncharacterized protein n=1 Tax=Prunus armeniaca TaxID=36596 RepID=A0A6J5W1K8_PRUAR|nr:unnamed protein product [Prunus armeniaca]
MYHYQLSRGDIKIAFKSCRRRVRLWLEIGDYQCWGLKRNLGQWQTLETKRSSICVPNLLRKYISRESWRTVDDWFSYDLAIGHGVEVGC